MEQQVWAKMAELRLACEREIEIQYHKSNSALASFRRSLQLIKSTAQRAAAEDQVKLGKLRVELGEAEDELVKAIAVKARKESQHMSIVDAIATTKLKVEELKQNVQDSTARKDEYTTILTQHLDALSLSEERIKQDTRREDKMEEANGWYSRVLGFHIEGGRGVKFIFTNINKECPGEEYSFTILHADDMYTLVDCSPRLDEIEDLIHELNKSNQLFGFVRTMRAEFLKASGSESSPPSTPRKGSSNLSSSSPLSSVVTEDRSESVIPTSEVQKNLNALEGATLLISSPASGLPVRRSVRLKAKGRRRWGKHG